MQQFLLTGLLMCLLLSHCSYLVVLSAKKESSKLLIGMKAGFHYPAQASFGTAHFHISHP